MRFQMPALLVSACILCACDDADFERRKQIIRERAAQLDQESTIIARREVRERWAIEDDHWYGKLPNGKVLRLDSPTLESRTTPHTNNAFIRWTGEITLTAERWKTLPPSDNSLPFALKYGVKMQDSKRLEIDAGDYSDMLRPTRKEISDISAAAEPPLRLPEN